MGNIHNYEKTLAKVAKQYLGSDSPLYEEDKEGAQRFYTQLMAEGITQGRITKYFYSMKTLSTMLKKPLGNANKSDIIQLVADISASTRWADWTKRDFKVFLRKYYKFLRGKDTEDVSWIKIKNSSKTLLPDDVLTEDEIKAIAINARTIRDKAFILCLYESGTRVGEFLPLKMKNVAFDEYGAVLRVSGKTGDRRIRIVASTPALKDWLDSHPYKNDPEAYLWVHERVRGRDRYLTYGLIRKMLKEASQKADIHKSVNPHAFRHARATFMASTFTDRQMKEFFGWRKSDTISTYTHLSGKSMDEAILKQHGITLNGSNGKPVISVKPCERCGQPNDPASKLCGKCYLPLDEPNKKALLDDYLFETLSALGEEFPRIKKRFAKIAEKKKYEGLFS